MELQKRGDALIKLIEKENAEYDARNGGKVGRYVGGMDCRLVDVIRTSD